MAPAVQRWLKVLNSLGRVDRVWITATTAQTFSACSVAVLAARVLEWPDARRIEVELIDAVDALPRFDAQASGPDDAITLSLFPAPLVEHNGSDIAVAATRNPAEAFGAVDLLRTFAADLAAAADPILGSKFLDEVLQRQENL